MIEYLFLIFLILFIIDSVIHVVAVYKENKKIILITKPLLMPLLALFFTFGALSLNIFNWLIVAALIGGCAGDTFLMFREKEKYFLVGMLSFLIGHVFYIIYFLSSLGINFMLFLISGPFLIIPVIIIIIVLLPKIKDGLGDMKIPVYVYMGVILFMHISAILRVTNFPLYCPCFLFVYIGSILFIISDALIAYDNFSEAKIPHVRVYIMITYILGQYLIIQGVLLSGII
ncbi:MAG: lysoplasmalogenase [Promethearchaeota archaeon]